jgi:hypothetical protein
MVSSGRLPGTRKIGNTGQAQRGTQILPAVHEMQAAAVASEDNFHIGNGLNNEGNSGYSKHVSGIELGTLY